MKNLLTSACLLAAPLWLTGQTITNTDPTPGNTYDYVQVNGTDVVNMGAGVTVNLDNSAYDNSTFNMSGGDVGRNNFAYNDSTFNMSGGDVDFNNLAYGDSTFNMSGGSVGYDNWAYYNSTFNMSGGHVGRDNYAYDNSTFNMWGGTIHEEFKAYEQSTINLWAQDFSGSDLQPGSGGFASFDFDDLIANQPGSGNPTGYNSVSFDLTWADGSNEEFYFLGYKIQNSFVWTGTLNLYDTDVYAPGVVPEPSTYALIAGALGLGLALLRRRR